MPDFNIYEEKILRTLVAARRPLTTKQVSKFSGISYNTVRSDLEGLFRRGIIRKMPMSNRIYWSV